MTISLPRSAPYDWRVELSDFIASRYGRACGDTWTQSSSASAASCEMSSVFSGFSIGGLAFAALVRSGAPEDWYRPSRSSP